MPPVLKFEIELHRITSDRISASSRQSARWLSLLVPGSDLECLGGMVNADVHRQLARQCRGLLKVTKDPGLIAQLETWAVECDRRADRALRAQPIDDIRDQARRHQMRAAEYRAVADQMKEPTVRDSFRRLAETYEAMARRLEARAEERTSRTAAS